MRYRSFESCSSSGGCYGKVAERLGQVLQGKMDLHAPTEHKRMDQKETRSDELLTDTVVNGPWML